MPEPVSTTSSVTFPMPEPAPPASGPPEPTGQPGHPGQPGQLRPADLSPPAPLSFPQLEVPAAPAPPAPGLPWQLPAGLLLCVVVALTLWGARALARRHQPPPDPLDEARAHLNRLQRAQAPAAETARHCAHIVSQAFARRYQEGVLQQSAARVLQRRAYLRQLPDPLRPGLLLFLAECVDSSYRPATEAAPPADLLHAASQLLDQARAHPPQRPRTPPRSRLPWLPRWPAGTGATAAPHSVPPPTTPPPPAAVDSRLR